MITIPKVSVRRLILGCNYTVTDAGISAGENLAGWIDSVEIIADGKTIFRADTDELPLVAALLAPYATDSLEDIDDLDVCPVASLYSDATPTTAELQRAWYVLNLPHDFRLYSDVEMRISWRAAQSEWGAASALTFKFFLGLQRGNVPRSLGVIRVASGSSTVHDISMGDYPVIAGIINCGTANYYDELRIKGKDGTYDVNINEPSALQAMYNAMAGVTPADDDVDYLFVPDMLVPWFPERKANLTLTTAAACTFLWLSILADSKPVSTAVKGDVKRGVAAAETRQYDPGSSARAITKMPALQVKAPSLLSRLG